MSKHKVFIILALIVVVAFSIRITAIFNWDSYLFDEQISVTIAQKPLSQMWSYLRWEMHPPLHFYYLHGWINTFGASEISGRISSLVLSLLSIIAMYFLGKEMFTPHPSSDERKTLSENSNQSNKHDLLNITNNSDSNPLNQKKGAGFNSKKAGLYASFLVAISSFQSFYSIWTRMYMLFFLLSILSFYFFLKALRQDKTKDWILTGLFTLLALYSHLTTLAIPAIMFIFVLYLKFKKEISTGQIKKFAVMLVINFLFFLPWLYNFVTLRLQSFSSRAWYFWAQGYDLFFINVPIRFMIAGNTVPLIETASLIIFGTLFLSAIFKWQKTSANSWQISSRINSGLVLSLLIMLVPLIAVYAINLNALRLYMLPAIGVYLLFAYGLAQINLGQYKKWLIVAIVAIVSVPLTEVIKLPEVGWEKMAHFIEEREQPGDKIINAVYGQLMMIDFYYQGNLEADAVIDDELRQDDRLLTILQTNFFPPVNAGNVDQLARLTQGHDRIFFVFSDHLFGDAQDVAVEWFIEDGWHLEEKLNIGGFTAPQVWLLTKIN